MHHSPDLFARLSKIQKAQSPTDFYTISCAGLTSVRLMSASRHDVRQPLSAIMCTRPKNAERTPQLQSPDVNTVSHCHVVLQRMCVNMMLQCPYTLVRAHPQPSTPTRLPLHPAPAHTAPLLLTNMP